MKLSVIRYYILGYYDENQFIRNNTVILTKYYVHMLRYVCVIISSINETSNLVLSMKFKNIY